MTHSPIAIVGMACIYPDAHTPSELWDNVLAQRRSFRRIPAERLRLEDYYDADPAAVDSTYGTLAALIRDYEFDRVAFRVANSTFEAADPAHWLALDVASRALVDAGFSARAGEPAGVALPRDNTGVILGNTLTGEFSRASSLRLRWPYVRRVVADSLRRDGLSKADLGRVLADLEKGFKEPFAEPSEETLAGGLSNTIAGRICNHFDLHGGGYTVDGACASSLLAVVQACSALDVGDMDVVLAGGVDLSLDPFELVGFARAGALARGEMKVFDERADGFNPGEGCGFVVLMRAGDAHRRGLRTYATLRGWGMSSDGSGGLTRPEQEGQRLALERAYEKAGFGVDTVGYFECHGTGTVVGDETELRTLMEARARSRAPASIGSIKGNIGHTKAAAGIAGLIKATLAVHHGVVPPTTGCETPHALLRAAGAPLQILDDGRVWCAEGPLRAGVSAMGFGGINTHVVVEAAHGEHSLVMSPSIPARDKALLRTAQDAELFLLGGADVNELLAQVRMLRSVAPGLASGDLADLAGHMASQVAGRVTAKLVRGAVVASSPSQLDAELGKLEEQLVSGDIASPVEQGSAFCGSGTQRPRIGFLFPGQGSPSHTTGGIWRRCFATTEELYADIEFPQQADHATEVAQPAIAASSVAALRVLGEVGITAECAVGHSLGELSALHWAGAFDDKDLVRIAGLRGEVMAALPGPTGEMAAIRASEDVVQNMLDQHGLPPADTIIAAYNAPDWTVIAGPAEGVRTVVDRARQRGVAATQLRVSHAFHSPLIAAAKNAFAERLQHDRFDPLVRPVFSTVTGKELPEGLDVTAHLRRQVVSPVQFRQALLEMAPHVDMLIEVGAGNVLTSLARRNVDVPVFATDAGGPKLRPFLEAMAAAYVRGAPLNSDALFAHRRLRPFDLETPPRFFVNPCERAPLLDPLPDDSVPASPPAEAAGAQVAAEPGASALEVIRELVAERTELPVKTIADESRMLGDLHLNSIVVGELVSETARRLGQTAPLAPTDFANATIAEIASALEGAALAPVPAETGQPSGVDAWVRTFRIEHVRRELRGDPQAARSSSSWRAFVDPSSGLSAQGLEDRFGALCNGDGVVVWLHGQPHRRHAELLLQSAKTALAGSSKTSVVLVHHRGIGAAFMRSLHLEHPEIAMCVVDLPAGEAAAWVEQVIAEAQAAATGDHTEARYESDGTRTEPRLALLDQGRGDDVVLSESDVVLVPGGGKGITAECALDLAAASGCAVALLGRSDPDTDEQLAANLHRFKVAELRTLYVRADITDADAVRAAVAATQAELGPVTAILFGAGTNEPMLIEGLDDVACGRALGPKVDGLENVLASIDPRGLRLLITFGSLIARAGLPGEAHYALANEWQTHITNRVASRHGHLRCLAVEWSAWSGVGMGERLATAESLRRWGIHPLSPDVGIAALRRLLADGVCGPVVVTGRFGEPPTLRMQKPELPLGRFLERPRVFVPGVEIISEVVVDTHRDLYLRDHVVDGVQLFPGVFGLEAMAQIACALAEQKDAPVFTDVAFAKPITVPKEGEMRLRIAALQREPGVVDVVVRSSETGFGVDHFSARCRFGVEEPATIPDGLADHRTETTPVDLDQDELYGRLLFQSGRFRRVAGYRELHAHGCVAELEAAADRTAWFGQYVPTGFVLSDPGARDATIHCLQACIPHATVLPLAVKRIVPRKTGQVPHTVHARERGRDGDILTYDVVVRDPVGEPIEVWEGLQLRITGRKNLTRSWPAPLLGPYLERRFEELVGGAKVRVAVERSGKRSDARASRTGSVVARALGRPVEIVHRGDGKPELAGKRNGKSANGAPAISVSHAGDYSFVVTGSESVACDVEPVRHRGRETWGDLLGRERLTLATQLAKQFGEEEQQQEADCAETRVWAAAECLKKAGVPDGPLVLRETAADGWAILGSGPFTIATTAVRLDGQPEPVVFAVLLKQE